MKRLMQAVFLCGFLFSPQLYALRCGHLLVNIGDYKDDVYDKCGEPDSVQSHYEVKGVENRAKIRLRNLNQFPNSTYSQSQSLYHDVEILVEEWKYDFGSTRLRKLLRFENGQLTDIFDLGRRR